MSERHRGRARTALVSVAAAMLLPAILVGCDAVAETEDSPGKAASTSPSDGESAVAEDAPDASLRTNVPRGATGVPIDRVVEVTVEGGRIDSVKMTSPAGPVDGKAGPDGRTWTASGRLEPGTRYVVRAAATGADGKQVTSTSRFTTQALTLDQQTYPSIAPLAGETVGVGMPVIVTFDVPVTDRASIERHLTVSSTPSQPGSWHWLSGNEVHWRPKQYWRPGTQVAVDVDINSVPAGNGIYGQESRRVEFQVGDAQVYKVNTRTHQMKVFSNGDLLRTIPITTGKAGFTTRSGVKVIMEKSESRRMRSETIGIPADAAEGYDIDNVRWAMRLTHSGEFIHAAPWSVGSQGYANVSHGCTGMSTENAGWLYAMSRRGDVVEYVGTDRPMTLENGYGDWNFSFADYREGSALS